MNFFRYIAVFFLFNGTPLLAMADCGDPYPVVSSGLDAWKAGDWERLYSFLSTSDREAVGLHEFREYRRAIYDSYIRLEKYKINGISKADNDRVVVLFTQYIKSGPGTRQFPSDGWRIEQSDAAWTLLCDGEGWKISLGLIHSDRIRILDSYRKIPFKFDTDQ